MYIQQTILCKHVKYVSSSENMVSFFINTGNIGIRKHHKKLTFWAFLNIAHFAIETEEIRAQNTLFTQTMF